MPLLNADRFFESADSEMESESRIRTDFEANLKPRCLSEFENAFGIDPHDYLMHEFALPIWEAELNREEMEKQQRIPKIRQILNPTPVTFETALRTRSATWNRQTCPAESYMDSYLRSPVTSAVDYCLAEAEKRNIIEDHRAFKLFCPLESIAEHLWMNNSKHLERQDLPIKQQSDIPLFKTYFSKHPRSQAPLSLRLTAEEAATIIQKRWKGTLTRRRPEIRALRRHMAAAKVQYGDPHKLVNELWEKEFQRAENVKEPEIQCPCPKKYPDPPLPPKLPPYLQEIKLHIETKLYQSEQKRRREQPGILDVETSVFHGGIYSDSDDADDTNKTETDALKETGEKPGSFSAVPNETIRKSQTANDGTENVAQNQPANPLTQTTKKHQSLSHPDSKESKDEQSVADASKKKPGKNVKPPK